MLDFLERSYGDYPVAIAIVIAVVVFLFTALFHLRGKGRATKNEPELILKIIQNSNKELAKKQEVIYLKEEENRQLKDALENLKRYGKWRRARKAIERFAFENDSEGARRILQEYILKNESKNITETAAAYRRLATIYKLENIDQAFRDCLRAVQLDPNNIDGWLSLAMICVLKIDRVGAEKAFSKVLELSKEDDSISALALGSLGNIYLAQGQYELAYGRIQRALEIYRELGDENGVATALANIGLVFQVKARSTQNTNNLLLAVEYIENGLKINLRLNNKEGAAYSYLNLGVVYNQLGRAGDAADLLKKSLALFVEQGNRVGESSANGNLAIVNLRKNNLSSAKQFAEKSLRIANDLNYELGTANANQYLGSIAKAEGDYRFALNHWERSLHIFRKLGATGKAQFMEKLIAELK